jgi:hypothetical protein
MPRTLLRAQGDGMCAGGSVTVWIERADTVATGISPLVRIEAETGARGEVERCITLPVAKLDAFLSALPEAIAEARRTGIL